jgi:hypothetical protein
LHWVWEGSQKGAWVFHRVGLSLRGKRSGSSTPHSTYPSLGLMYDNGLGVPQSNETAVKWWTLAAKQGIAGADRKYKGPYRESGGP